MDDDRNNLWDYLTAYGKYKQTLNDLEKYNRADTVNMSENEMNKFRHIAGPAYLTSTYYKPNFVRKMGYLKEAKDLIMGRGLADTKIDLQNNEKGMELGNRMQGAPQSVLFNYIFNKEIKPYR